MNLLFRHFPYVKIGQGYILAPHTGTITSHFMLGFPYFSDWECTHVPRGPCLFTWISSPSFQLWWSKLYSKPQAVKTISPTKYGFNLAGPHQGGYHKNIAIFPLIWKIQGDPKKMSLSVFELTSFLNVGFDFSACGLETESRARFISPL